MWFALNVYSSAIHSIPPIRSKVLLQRMGSLCVDEINQVKIKQAHAGITVVAIVRACLSSEYLFAGLAVSPDDII